MDTAISIKIETLNVHMSTFTDAAARGFDIPSATELTAGIPSSQAAGTHICHTKVLSDGTRISSTDLRTDHVAVIDQVTGLMWAVESLGDPSDADTGISQEQCIQRCKDLRLLGHDDWRLPTRAELVALVDDTRHEPAIDNSLFPRVKPRWHWTSTAAAWSSASAWLVGFSYGSVSSLRRDYDGFALAVRRAGQ